MLGDAERPADLRARSFGVGVSHSADGFGWDAGFAFGALERVFFDVRLVRLEIARGMPDELFIGQTSGNDFTGDRIGQRDIGAHIDAEPSMGPFGRTGSARIDDIELGAVLYAFEQVVEENRMRFASIRSPKQDDVGLFDLAI